MKLATAVFTILLLIACGNIEEKQFKEETFKDNFDPLLIKCMGDSCKNHNECLCDQANICISSIASMDPEIGDNVNICTIKNCALDSTTSCPENWKCYKVPMANDLFGNAETICIKVLD